MHTVKRLPAVHDDAWNRAGARVADYCIGLEGDSNGINNTHERCMAVTIFQPPSENNAPEARGFRVMRFLQEETLRTDCTGGRLEN